MRNKRTGYLIILFLPCMLAVASLGPANLATPTLALLELAETPAVTLRPVAPETRSPMPPPGLDKWSLWIGCTQLRGANIWQRRVYTELDGPEFMCPGPVGPPYTQENFDRLSALGANYVNISHPGLFSETPPYEPDPQIREHLDNLLTMIAQADLFAVISFRTGPGRSEFTFLWDEVGDWFDESYLNDGLWQDRVAQDAWVAMWRYTAERYRDDPIVVGYDLMVEPNANEVGSHALDDALDIWDPDEFYSVYERGINHALWVWDPEWEPWSEQVNAFNFRFGPDLDDYVEVANDLQDVIVKYWRRNMVRPSNWIGGTR